MRLEKLFESISVSSELKAVRWRVPGSRTSVTEATFTELRLKTMFDVVSSVGGPQTGSMAGYHDLLHIEENGRIRSPNVLIPTLPRGQGQ